MASFVIRKAFTPSSIFVKSKTYEETKNRLKIMFATDTIVISVSIFEKNTRAPVMDLPFSPTAKSLINVTNQKPF